MKKLLTFMLMCSLLPKFTSGTTFTCLPEISKTCNNNQPSGESSLSILIADLDGDKNHDIVIYPQNSTTSDSANTRLLTSNGYSSFQKYLTNDLNSKNTVLTIGDFDGDGKQDILTRRMTPIEGQNTAEISFYQGKGDFTTIALPNSYNIQADSTIIITGDFDGDGKTDFIAQPNGTQDDMNNPARIFLSRGNGSFAIKDIFFNGDARNLLSSNLANIIVGDFNGDGLDDFIRQNKKADNDDKVPSAVLFISNGDGTFTLHNLPEDLNLRGDLCNLVVGDFNGDCIIDFIRQSICQPVPQVQASWTDWRAFTLQTQAGQKGQATGTFMVDNVAVTVTFEGSVNDQSKTDDQAVHFINFPQTFVNGPTTGDWVALSGIESEFSDGKIAQKITFSHPVTNPRLALWSVGDPVVAVQYDFGSIPVTIISTGPASVPGSTIPLTIPSGSIVQGQESNGIIELTGTFTEVPFTVNYEDYHAFTVGIAPTVLVPCNDQSTLNLGTATGDLFTANLPASYKIEGVYSTLHVDDINCDGRDDFIKHENRGRPSSTEDEITVFLSNLETDTDTDTETPFAKKAQSEVYEDTSVLAWGQEQSRISLGDINGDGRADYVQSFGDTCFAIVYAQSGKCQNEAKQCKKSHL